MLPWQLMSFCMGDYKHNVVAQAQEHNFLGGVMQVHSSSPSWRRLAPPPHVTQHQWWSGSRIHGTTKLQHFLLEPCSSSDLHSSLLMLSVMSYSKYGSQVIIIHVLTVLSACVRALVLFYGIWLGGAVAPRPPLFLRLCYAVCNDNRQTYQIVLHPVLSSH